MGEKRDKTRHTKRLSLKFGMETAERVGFTEDVSREGFFIKTIHHYPPNSKLIVELYVKDQIVKIEGQVRWIKKVPPGMIHYAKKSGIGFKILRFISGEEIFNGLFEDK